MASGNLTCALDDMEFAPDFLSYFAYSAPFLAENSETTLCVSAWNDHGQSHLVADPSTRKPLRHSGVYLKGYVTQRNCYELTYFLDLAG